jgi:hypothetical protein
LQHASLANSENRLRHTGDREVIKEARKTARENARDRRKLLAQMSR